MAISRLFVEIGKDVDRLNASLRQSMDAAKEAGIQVTASGQRMLAAFDRALNPTKDLAEQIRLLEKAGKSNADIWAVYGQQMKSAADATSKNGQAVDATVAKHLDLNKATSAGRLNFENFGRSIQDFARNPLQAAQSGMTSLLGSLGPTAVGILGVATAAGVAAKALVDMGIAAAEEAEGLHNLSISTGLRTQQLQALKQIGKEAGLESLDLGRAIGMLNKQLGSKEGGDFTKALVDADIALEDTSGNSKDVIKLLDELRGKFSGIADPIERANKMHAALGGRLRDLIPLLMSSNDGLEKQIKAMEATGPVWDDITQEKLMKFESALDQIGRTWTSLVTDIKAGVGSILGDLTDLSGMATEGLDKLTDEQRVAMHIASQPSSAKLQLPEGPFTSVDVESFKQSEKISRDLFEAHQKLIAQGADFISVRMQIAEAEQTFQQLLNKGTREQVEDQARVLAGLNRHLKELQQAKPIADSYILSMRELAEWLLRLNGGYKQFNADLVENNRLLDEQAKKDMPLWQREPLEAPAATKIGDMGIDEVSKAFDEYRKNIEEMQQHASVYVQTAQEEQLAALQVYYEEVQTLRDLDLISEQEASDAKKRIAAEEAAVKLSKAQEFFGTLAQIQTSHIRAIAAIGKAAAIVQATINTYEGATKALAQGGIWGAIQMGAILAAGFAQVHAIASQGFKEGGLVSGGEKIIRINEQGPEFVMNADATKDFLPLLQMLNSGESINNRFESTPAFSGLIKPSLNVQIANYGSSKQFDVEQVDETTVRVIARDEAISVLTARGPEVIANDLAFANSRTSKAIARNTTARRVR